jgi:hypothetical protein
VLYYIEYKGAVALTGRRVSCEIRFAKYVQELNNIKRRKCKGTLKYRALILFWTDIFRYADNAT